MDEDRGRLPIFLGAAFVALTGLLALKVLLRPDASGPAPSSAGGAARQPMSRAPRTVFDDARESERIQAELAERELGFSKEEEAAAPVLPAVQEPPPSRPAPLPEAAPAPAPPPAPPPAARVSNPAPAEPSPELSGSDRSQLASAGAPGSPEDAARFGASFSWMAKVLVALGKHPRLAGYLLNNEQVVKGFMSRPTTRQTCSDPAKLKKFFMDTADPGGISRSLPIARQVAQAHPDMPLVIASSRLVTEILDCPSFNGFLGDPSAVKDVALANPQLLANLTEPHVLDAIMKSPAAWGAFQKAQAGAF